MINTGVNLSETSEFSCSMSDGGHFEKGRWVSPFDALFTGSDDKEPTFEVTLTCDVPIFRQGAVIRWEQEHFAKTFTQSELRAMFKNDREGAAFGPCCLPQVRP